MVEEAIVREDDPEEFTPKPGSGVEQLMNAIPESQKLDSYDYKKLKMEALRKKFDL